MKPDRRDIPLLIGWAIIVTTIIAWERNGGVADLASGGAETLGSLGRLLGLSSATLLALQIFSMARVPLLEKSAGQDRLARWHRWSGFWSFWLLIGHVVIITLAYSSDMKNSIVGEFIKLVLTWPGMLMALVATVLFVMVVFTSIRAARKKLRYESWHLIHIYAYLGLVLTIPHEIWVGSDLFSGSWARFYWWVLNAGAMGAVLLYRLVMPLLKSLRSSLTVEKVEITGAWTSITFKGKHLDKLKSEPGQFFVWRFLTKENWSVGHPYSLSAPMSRNGARITIGTKGDDGARLKSLKKGTRVIIEGPYGVMTTGRKSKPKTAFFGSGIGLTPLLAMLHSEAAKGRLDNVALVNRISAQGDTPHREELEEMARKGLRWFELVGPRARTGAAWLPRGYEKAQRNLLAEMLGNLKEYDFYICGPGPWADSLLENLERAGVEKDAIHHETFNW